MKNSGAVFVEPHTLRRRVQIDWVEESLTMQSFKDECDANRILANYMRTGQLPPSHRQGVYADVTNLQGDLTEKISAARATKSKAREALRNKAKDKAAAAASASQGNPAGGAPARTPIDDGGGAARVEPF